METGQIIIAAISAFFAFLGIVVNGVVVFMVARLNTRAAEAAITVSEIKLKAEKAASASEEVKLNLVQSSAIVDGKLKEIVETGQKTKLLVNSSYGIQLKISSIALSRLAKMEGATEEDRIAAKEAEKQWIDHEKQQEKVNKVMEAAVASVAVNT